MRYRSGISLFGGGSRAGGGGISLFGGCTIGDTSLDSFTKEYIQLKNFIVKTFMKPIIRKDIDIVNLNTFNFTYLLKKLNSFSNFFNDAEVFIKLIETIKSTIEVSNENAKLYDIVYGKAKDTQLLFRTTAVEFLPEVQIYIQLYGKPKELSEFDEQLIHDIKQILLYSETITFDEIKEKLGYDTQKEKDKLDNLSGTIETKS